MIIYEVNLLVDDAIDNEFEPWLRAHVEEMLGFEGFATAEILKQQPGDVPDAEAGKQYWTVLYRVVDRSSLDNYLTEHAMRMRQEGLTRFPGLRVWRRILAPPL